MSPVRRTTLFLCATASLLASVLSAQDISGDWQGTIKTGSQETGRYRYVLHIAKENGGAWKAALQTIDQRIDWGAAQSVNSLNLQGSNLKLSVVAPDGTFEGRVSAGGDSIAGTWMQGPPRQLEFLRPTAETKWHDESPHTVQFITVDKNVQLEVLDWGGSGRPLVFLAGLGNTAHIFDRFAPKLTAAYHVYGITRRGYGASSVPASGYGADRLGDDVLEVIDALKLNRPLLAGHSIAGEELSSVGSRHPEKISGLIYLDAGYSYAYYARSLGDFDLDLHDVRRKLEQLENGMLPQDAKPFIQDLLETSLPAFERDLRAREKSLVSELASAPPSPSQPPPRPPFVPVAIQAGTQQYTDIRVPILAIFAVPHEPPASIRDNPTALAAFDAQDEASTGEQARAFERGLPSARVVRLPHANHYVFFSNETDVLREMNAFLASLPR